MSWSISHNKDYIRNIAYIIMNASDIESRSARLPQFLKEQNNPIREP